LLDLLLLVERADQGVTGLLPQLHVVLKIRKRLLCDNRQQFFQPIRHLRVNRVRQLAQSLLNLVVLLFELCSSFFTRLQFELELLEFSFRGAKLGYVVVVVHLAHLLVRELLLVRDVVVRLSVEQLRELAAQAAFLCRRSRVA